MKVRIKDWNDAVKAALADSENWDVKLVENDSIFCIERKNGEWGMVVEGYEEGRYFCASTYTYPMCVVDKLQDEKPNDYSDDVLRYGKIVTDDDVLWGNHAVRIRLISYDGDLYYHKMVNSDVVECRKIGMAYVVQKH